MDKPPFFIFIVAILLLNVSIQSFYNSVKFLSSIDNWFISQHLTNFFCTFTVCLTIFVITSKINKSCETQILFSIMGSEF